MLAESSGTQEDIPVVLSKNTDVYSWTDPTRSSWMDPTRPSVQIDAASLHLRQCSSILVPGVQTNTAFSTYLNLPHKGKAVLEKAVGDILSTRDKLQTPASKFLGGSTGFCAASSSGAMMVKHQSDQRQLTRLWSLQLWKCPLQTSRDESSHLEPTCEIRTESKRS